MATHVLCSTSASGQPGIVTPYLEHLEGQFRGRGVGDANRSVSASPEKRSPPSPGGRDSGLQIAAQSWASHQILDTGASALRAPPAVRMRCSDCDHYHVNLRRDRALRCTASTSIRRSPSPSHCVRRLNTATLITAPAITIPSPIGTRASRTLRFQRFHRWSNAFRNGLRWEGRETEASRTECSTEASSRGGSS